MVKKTKAVIRKRFTLVIPKEIREQLQLHEEDPVMLTVDNDRIIIEPIRDSPFDRLAELGKDVEYDRKAREEASRKLQELAAE